MMQKSTLVSRIEIPPTALVSHGSWGSTPIGTAPSTMELHKIQEGRYYIEWDIPDIQTTENIGIWVDSDGELTDYDGVFSLPAEAVKLLRDNNIKVSHDFE